MKNLIKGSDKSNVRSRHTFNLDLIAGGNQSHIVDSPVIRSVLNDTEKTEFYLIDFTERPFGWDATLCVTRYDHFGLDYNDAEKYQIYNEGFAAWWRLQHCFNNNPFETRILIEVPLSYTLFP